MVGETVCALRLGEFVDGSAWVGHFEALGRPEVGGVVCGGVDVERLECVAEENEVIGLQKGDEEE